MATDSWALAVDEQEAAADSVRSTPLTRMLAGSMNAFCVVG